MDYLKGINIGFNKRIKDGITYYTVPSFEPYVNFAFCGDVSNNMAFKAIRGADIKDVQMSFKKLCSVLDMPYNSCVMTNIVHGDNIIKIEDIHKGHGVSSAVKLSPCDGLITDKAEIPIASTHADCMPIAFFDKENKVGCVVHAGWRGILAGIQSRAIEMLIKEYNADSKNILVAIGPTINKCCFVVDKDVTKSFTDAYFRDDFVINDGEKDKLDLMKIVISSILNFGIPASNITVDGRCTACQNSKLASFRRDREKAGTMVQIMCIK